MVFVWVRVVVNMFGWLVNVMVVMVFTQHQPGANRHDRHREPEQSLGHFLQQRNGKQCANEGRAAKEGAGARRPQTTHGQDE